MTMGPGSQIPQLVTFTPEQIIQQFYAGQLLQRIQTVVPQIPGMFIGLQQNQMFTQLIFIQQPFGPQLQAPQIITQPNIGEGLQLHMYNVIYQVAQQQQQQQQHQQQSNLLVLPQPGTMGHSYFQATFNNPTRDDAQDKLQQQPIIKPPTMTEQRRLKDKYLDTVQHALIQRLKQDEQGQQLFPKRDFLYTQVDPPELSLDLNQDQFKAHQRYWSQRSCTLRYLVLKEDGSHHTENGQGKVNVRIFLQRHARHEILDTNDWRSFRKESDTDLHLDTILAKYIDKDDDHKNTHQQLISKNG
ncbi:MAG: hypothetical protein EZS28_040717 [Streblomastix strix]|uniref:Uncharacterized protein n=1 Tax=Streblomastix strix TaxID=222440 RepID=A0A5J4TZ58_9EUKA|nr:MAG: hypothetical protein EZS28_040717 [Streblomastix strix]